MFIKPNLSFKTAALTTQTNHNTGAGVGALSQSIRAAINRKTCVCERTTTIETPCNCPTPDLAEVLAVGSEGDPGQSITLQTTTSGLNSNISGDAISFYENNGNIRSTLSASTFEIFSSTGTTFFNGRTIELSYNYETAIFYMTNTGLQLGLKNSGYSSPYYGSTGQVLTSNGPNSAMTWEDAGTGVIPTLAEVLTAGPTGNTGQSITLSGVTTNTTTNTNVKLTIGDDRFLINGTYDDNDITMSTTIQPGFIYMATTGGVGTAYADLSIYNGKGLQLSINGNNGSPGQVLTSGGSTGPLTWEDAGTGVTPTLAEVLTAGSTGDTGQSITLEDDTSTIEIFGSKIGLNNSYGLPGQVLTSGGDTGPLTWEDAGISEIPTLAEVLTVGSTGNTGQSITLQDDTSTIEIFGSKIGLDNSYGLPGQVLTSGGDTGPLTWEDAGTGVTPTLAEVLTAGSTGNTGQSITLQDDTSTIEIFGSKIGLDNSYGSYGQVLTSGGPTGPMAWKDSVTDSVPIGTILPFAGLTLPDKYLWCDGASLVQTDYPELFNVIGSVYGGDSTNFNVPDLRSKFPIGSDSNSSIGVSYNSSNVVAGGNSTISLNQIPDHHHAIVWDNNLTTLVHSINAESGNASGADKEVVKAITYSITSATQTSNITPTYTQTNFLPPFTSIQYIIKKI